MVERTDHLVERCRGRSVLHLGCSNAPYTKEAIASGALLHARLAEAAREIWGLDADPAGLEALRALGFGNLVAGDLERLDAAPLDRAFQVVVAGEVIEHLSDPGLFLRGVRRFLSDDGALVVTTVNAYAAFRFAQYATRGQGGANEPVHPDHVAYYSHATLGRLLVRERYRVERFLFYGLGKEHRPFVSWRVRLVNDVATWLAPHLADGLIAECRPAGDAA